MFTKVSVLIPTRGRIERLQTLLASYERTSAGDNSELLFRVDDDDLETRNLLLGYGRCRMSVGPRSGGYGNMPSFFNELAVLASGDVLMCGNDDMIFQTNGWAALILETANQYPDGLFDLGVSTHNEAHFPFSVVSRRAAEKMGFIWDPRIFWGDIFLRDVISWFGRTVLLPHVRIDHDWAGFKPDQVYNETMAAKAPIEGSASYWSSVHAPAVAEAVEKLKGLLA